MTPRSTTILPMRAIPAFSALCIAAVFVPGPGWAEPETYRLSGLPPGEPLSIRAEPAPSAAQLGEIRGPGPGRPGPGLGAAAIPGAGLTRDRGKPSSCSATATCA